MKTAVITGCNRGLGFKVANILLENSFKVIGLNRTSAEITHENYIERYYNSNFDDSSLNKLMVTLEHEHVDILILNAAIYYEDAIQNMSIEDITSILYANSIAPLALIKKFEEKLIETKGKVISIGSATEFFIMKDSEFYSISKKLWRSIIQNYSRSVNDKGISVTHLILPRLDTEFGISTTSVAKEILEISSQPRHKLHFATLNFT